MKITLQDIIRSNFLFFLFFRVQTLRLNVLFQLIGTFIIGGLMFFCYINHSNIQSKVFTQAVPAPTEQVPVNSPLPEATLLFFQWLDKCLIFLSVNYNYVFILLFILLFINIYFVSSSLSNTEIEYFSERFELKKQKIKKKHIIFVFLIRIYNYICNFLIFSLIYICGSLFKYSGTGIIFKCFNFFCIYTDKTQSQKIQDIRALFYAVIKDNMASLKPHQIELLKNISNLPESQLLKEFNLTSEIVAKTNFIDLSTIVTSKFNNLILKISEIPESKTFFESIWQNDIGKICVIVGLTLCVVGMINYYIGKIAEAKLNDMLDVSNEAFCAAVEDVCRTMLFTKNSTNMSHLRMTVFIYRHLRNQRLILSDPAFETVIGLFGF